MDELIHGQLGRQFEWVEDWWRRENTKGALATCGSMWISHPTWRTPIDRLKWHENLGELLNYHATVSVVSERVGAEGAVHNRLTLLLAHRSATRLQVVQDVAGGSWQARDSDAALQYLRIQGFAAGEVIKAGRLFCDPDNRQLFEVFDAALSFRMHLPGSGNPNTEEQLTAQEYWKGQIIDRMGAYTRPGQREHDCGDGVERAGSSQWARRDPIDPLQRLLTAIQVGE